MKSFICCSCARALLQSALVTVITHLTVIEFALCGPVFVVRFVNYHQLFVWK